MRGRIGETFEALYVVGKPISAKHLAERMDIGSDREGAIRRIRIRLKILKKDGLVSLEGGLWDVMLAGLQLRIVEGVMNS